eukprot:1149421-Pelagomonas_calceolata.AAC.9
MLAQKSTESPPPRSYKTGNATGDLEGCWKQPAPEPGCMSAAASCSAYEVAPSEGRRCAQLLQLSAQPSWLSGNNCN